MTILTSRVSPSTPSLRDSMGVPMSWLSRCWIQTSWSQKPILYVRCQVDVPKCPIYSFTYLVVSVISLSSTLSCMFLDSLLSLINERLFMFDVSILHICYITFTRDLSCFTVFPPLAISASLAFFTSLGKLGKTSWSTWFSSETRRQPIGTTEILWQQMGIITFTQFKKQKHHFYIKSYFLHH